MHRENKRFQTLSFLLTAAMISLVPLLVGCRSVAWVKARWEQKSWEVAQSADSIDAYESFLNTYSKSKHAEEARARLFLLEFKSASRSNAQPVDKQEFIAKYPGTSEATAVSKDLETMAIVDMEYPDAIEPTGSSSNPTWSFRIVFHERNGVAARINYDSMGGFNSRVRWWDRPDVKGENWWDRPLVEGDIIHLPAKGTHSYSSWVRGERLRGSHAYVSFQIRDKNGHSYSKIANFKLK